MPKDLTDTSNPFFDSTNQAESLHLKSSNDNGLALETTSMDTEAILNHSVTRKLENAPHHPFHIMNDLSHN